MIVPSHFLLHRSGDLGVMTEARQCNSTFFSFGWALFIAFVARGLTLKAPSSFPLTTHNGARIKQFSIQFTPNRRPKRTFPPVWKEPQIVVAAQQVQKSDGAFEAKNSAKTLQNSQNT